MQRRVKSAAGDNRRGHPVGPTEVIWESWPGPGGRGSPDTSAETSYRAPFRERTIQHARRRLNPASGRASRASTPTGCRRQGGDLVANGRS